MSHTRRRPALGTPTAEQNAATADEFDTDSTDPVWIGDAVADLWAAWSLARHLGREVAK